MGRKRSVESRGSISVSPGLFSQGIKSKTIDAPSPGFNLKIIENSYNHNL
jgi:hypothetical protein